MVKIFLKSRTALGSSLHPRCAAAQMGSAALNWMVGNRAGLDAIVKPLALSR